MDIYTFVYNKGEGDATKRFVAVSQSDNNYVRGYDLVDGIYKTFCTDKIQNSVFLSRYDNKLLSGARVKTKAEIINLINWDESQRKMFSEMDGTPYQLVKILFNKTGINATALTADHFLVFADPKVAFSLRVGEKSFTMIIKESGIQYYDSVEHGLSEKDFIRAVLS